MPPLLPYLQNTSDAARRTANAASVQAATGQPFTAADILADGTPTGPFAAQLLTQAVQAVAPNSTPGVNV
jgi:hypothetical protein